MYRVYSGANINILGQNLIQTMRRLILEVSEKELFKAGIELPPLKEIKSLELLYFLRQDPKEFAAISRIEFKNDNVKIDDLLKEGLLVDAQVIEREKNGAYIMFTRSGYPALTAVLNYIGMEGGYLFPPLGIEDGKVKFSFIGSEAQIRDFMEKIDAIGIRYRVVLLADANFSPISPLSQLTEKQQIVLLNAYKMGYYDIPRKVGTEEIAKKLGIVDSTLVEHLRKAEQRIIKQIIENKTQ
ncbi:MAG: helix-turn-helix domain-containing protein [Candidatus Bathyarchaeota archaeon]|nr:helix-turn-helix domain-containing protein [Candidatus Bathyarchaeota archaeon]